MVAVIAAAFDGGGRNVIPCGLVCDEFQRLLQRASHFFRGMLTPRQQVETGTAAERGTIDITVDTFTQQHRNRMFDGVQATGRNRILIRLHQTQIIIGNHIAIRTGLRVDITHIRSLHLGVVELEAFHNRLVFCHHQSFLQQLFVSTVAVLPAYVNLTAIHVADNVLRII